MPRVLIVATNTETEPHPVYPLGASTVASALLAEGCDVIGLDLGLAADPVPTISAAIADFRPGVVALSVRAIDNTSSEDTHYYLPGLDPIVAAVRESTSSPLVFGGSGYSLFPQPMLSRFSADYGIQGEGERLLPELVRELAAGRDPAPGNGLYARKADKILGGPSTHRLPPKAWRGPNFDVFPLEPYVEKGGPAPIQTKRGCPQNCTYCTYPILEGCRIRLRDPADVVDDVRMAAEAGTSALFFVDANFNSSPRHALAVCEALKRSEIRLRWSAFVTPLSFESRLADSMARCGARSVEVGSEAGTEATLRGLGKQHSPDQVLKVDRWCRDAGVAPAHYFVFGGPEETPETVERTLELIDSLSGPVVAMIGLRIYPGTGLFTRAVAEERISPSDDLLDPVFYISPQLDRTALRSRLLEFAADHPKFLVVGHPVNRDAGQLERLRKKGRSGSLWEYFPS